MARTHAASRPSALDRWARFAHRHRWWVIGAWVVALVGVIALSRVAGGKLSDNFTLPGSESQSGIDLLKSQFPAQAGDTADLVFQAQAGISDPAIKARVDTLLARVATMPGVASVDSPYDPAHASAISADGTIAHAVVHWKTRAANANEADVQNFVDAADAAAGNGLRVEAGGNVVMKIERGSFSSESIGLLAAVVILFIAFGSLVAMGLPVIAALFGIGSAISVVTLAANFYDFPNFSTQFLAMIGLGVGIDYCLLVVTRFREGLHTGHGVEDSIALALTTAGRSVIFAGAVVTIAFFGLFAMNIPFIAALGAATAMVVITSVLVALTLMPAILSLAGTRVDSIGFRFLRSTEGVNPNSVWFRFARRIQRRPLPYALASVAFLVVIGLPIFSLQMGFTDSGNNPTSYHTRRAYDLLSEGFGVGINGPIPVVVDVADGGANKVPAVVEAIKATPGVASVQAPRLNDAKTIAVITVYANTKPQSTDTTDLVHRIRSQVLPGVLGGSGAKTYVAGAVASQIDIGDRISARMPLLFIGVIGLSFLLLMTVFRSVVVALKAAIMNLLSIGAAYGVVVAIFQWGWGASLLGVQKGPVEAFLPMMFFTILFGLSMDYEVFLISRIREVYMKTGNTQEAVAHGLAATARVITAAAAIMVAVFLAFVLGDQRVIKEVGLGLATAIFVDATVVRLVLVPATMELLGKWNWWLPSWLGRLLPEVHLEGGAVTSGHEPEAVPAGGQ